MGEPLRIGVIGDFNPTFLSHFAMNAAVYDAAASLGIPLEIRWLSTTSLEGSDAPTVLGRCDALIASSGSPYKGFHGMLRGIEFARTHNVVFGGT
jgi:CTP synthase (UTP-ammonia lyase)